MKKGFTLIESLATIVILAVIALIVSPMINNVIDNARKSAYKSSVEGIISSASNYIASYVITNNDNIKGTTFTCDGISCTNGSYSLEFNGDVPKSGTIIVNSEEDIEANYITNGKYCATGTKGNINVSNMCSYLDDTAPVINSDYILQSTSNSVIVTIPSGYSIDNESNVIEYKIDIYNNDTLVKEVIRTDINSSITEEFTNLFNNTEYKVIVRAINGNNLETTKEKSIVTNSIINPTISYENNPSSSINGYLLYQVVKVVYDNTNVENASYYIKSTRVGTSNIDISKSCGTGTIPSDCSDINSITSIEANTWYEVSGNIEITYVDNSIEENTLYALTYDGTNYSNASTGTISKIDKEIPTVTTSVSGKVGTLTMTDNESGISSYCVNTSDTIVGCTWSDTTSTTATYTATSAGTYYAFAKDKLGNVSNSSSFEILQSAFCSLVPGQVFNYAYTGNYQTFTATCDGTYKFEAWGAQGGSASSFIGGTGSYTVGTIYLNKGDTIYVYVGGIGSAVSSGTLTTGGYNGGGTCSCGTGNYSTGCGGGATDFRLVSGSWSDAVSLRSRIMVAAGGGGGHYRSDTTSKGGYGGTINGYSAREYAGSYAYNYAGGASHISGGGIGNGNNENTAYLYAGSFGYGGGSSAVYNNSTGGGSGYYGGGSGRFMSGGGGSSYISGYKGCVAVTSASSTSPKSGCTNGTSDITCSYHYSGLIFNNTNMIAGNASMPTHDGTSTMTGNSGNGYAKITLVSLSDIGKQYNTMSLNSSLAYNYTNEYQVFNVPVSGTYKLEAWGAQGGNASSFIGGTGSYTVGTIYLNKGDTIYVYVGGMGSAVSIGALTTGGYNGGGNCSCGTGNYSTGCGGGATDFRLLSGGWSDTLSLRSRIMVAAGGGGGHYRSDTTSKGGYGGTINGYSAREYAGSYAYNYAGGASQISGGGIGNVNNENTAYLYAGSFGYGGGSSAVYNNSTGGGSGYYGGGSGRFMSGGGGSSYISGYKGCVAVTSASSTSPKSGCTNGTSDITCSYHYSGLIFNNTNMIAGNASMPTHDGTSTMTGNSGNGYAKITLVSLN